MSYFSKLKKVVSRRGKVLERLKDQLKRNTKTLKNGDQVPLSEKDVARINKELFILKERVS